MNTGYKLNIDYIKQLLEQEKMSIKDLQERLSQGMPQPPNLASIKRWLNEKNPSMPRFDIGLKLSNIFHIEPSELLVEDEAYKVQESLDRKAV